MKIFSNITFPIFVFISISFISNTFANDFPNIKSGYWETKTSDGGTIKQCLDSKSLKEIFTSATQKMQGTCDKLSIVKKGDKYISSANCKMLGSVMSVTSEVSGDFSKEYVSRTTTKIEPPLMGQSGNSSTETSKFISTKCPNGMVAGDIVSSDGTKMNANKMLENMPDMKNINKMMEGIQNGQGIDQAQIQKMMEEMQRNMGQ